MPSIKITDPVIKSSHPFSWKLFKYGKYRDFHSLTPPTLTFFIIVRELSMMKTYMSPFWKEGWLPLYAKKKFFENRLLTRAPTLKNLIFISISNRFGSILGAWVQVKPYLWIFLIWSGRIFIPLSKMGSFMFLSCLVLSQWWKTWG